MQAMRLFDLKGNIAAVDAALRAYRKAASASDTGIGDQIPVIQAYDPVPFRLRVFWSKHGFFERSNHSPVPSKIWKTVSAFIDSSVG